MNKSISYPLNLYLEATHSLYKKVDVALARDAERIIDSLMNQYNSEGLKYCKMLFKDGISVTAISKSSNKSEEDVIKLIWEGEKIIENNKSLLIYGYEYYISEARKIKEQLLKDLGGKVPVINN